MMQHCRSCNNPHHLWCTLPLANMTKAEKIATCRYKYALIVDRKEKFSENCDNRTIWPNQIEQFDSAVEFNLKRWSLQYEKPQARSPGKEMDLFFSCILFSF